MERITIGIFDDHPIISDGLHSFLSKEYEIVDVVFCANTKQELLNKLNEVVPQILILDIVAPDVSGLELFDSILATYPELKIIAYSTLKSIILVENLLNIGVKGFVNKSQAISDLFQAVLTVHKNEISVPQKYHFLTSRFRITEAKKLTKREMEIVMFIAQQATTTEIAEKLSLSTKTIENHKSNIFKKLDVKNSAGLVLVATRLGYIS